MQTFSRGTSLPLVLLAAGSATAAAAPPSDSAYVTDAQTSYVQDATSDSIGQVNMITCVIHSMRPDALVNQGPYVALIDKNTCDAAKSGGATSSANVGATQAPDYMTAVVDSTRASNSDPMLVRAWISINQDGQPVTVFAHVSASEAPSAANPYGTFRMDYCGKGPTDQACLMNGFMQGGNGTLSYYEADTSPGGSNITALQLASVGTASGSGKVSVEQSGNGNPTSTSSYDFAYDQSYFLRVDSASASECFSRDATDPATGLSVWQYGLYDASTGARIERNSGFPIQYTSGGASYQGYVGYYGLSLQADAPAPADGSTVQKVDYQDGTATKSNFTVATNGGRLTRYTRKSRTLRSLDKIRFVAFIGAVANLGLPDPNTQYEMYWDDTTGRFVVTGEQVCGQGGCQINSIPQPQSLDPSVWANTGGVQGWSQSLGGDVFVDLSGLTGTLDSSSVTVVYHLQDLVYPDDTTTPATLYCADNCPTAASLQAYLTQGMGNQILSPYAAATYNNFQPLPAGGLVTYNLANAVLSSAGQPVVDVNPADYQSNPQYQNGVMSGRLFVNLSDAQCQDAASPPDYCDYQVNSAPVYYVWQTGPGAWNQFAAIKDGTGSFVHFDAPLQANFEVPAGASYGPYSGTSLVLQYGGFGNLWGIPGSCVSGDTNLPVDCSTQNSRNVPSFVIPYDPAAVPQQGKVTTSSDGVTSTYLVKWLQREIRFAVKATSVCSNDQLQQPANVQLPTAAGLKDPTSSSSDVFLGTEPTITSAPRVIQGEVKY